MTLRALAPALVALSLLAGCTPETSPTPPGEVAGSDQQRLTTAAPSADLAAAVAGNTDFALDLYRKLGARDPGNLFVSPQSITLAIRRPSARQLLVHRKCTSKTPAGTSNSQGWLAPKTQANQPA